MSRRLNVALSPSLETKTKTTMHERLNNQEQHFKQGIRRPQDNLPKELPRSRMYYQIRTQSLLYLEVPCIPHLVVIGIIFTSALIHRSRLNTYQAAQNPYCIHSPFYPRGKPHYFSKSSDASCYKTELSVVHSHRGMR